MRSELGKGDRRARELTSSLPSSFSGSMDQLRDHLALAATCRYFRTCYRDGESEGKRRLLNFPAFSS